MQLELVRLQQSVGITFVIVTHDQDEALSMANRIAVMESGKVRQIAPPADLYEFPNCKFVADFIGKMNLFEGKVTGVSGDQIVLEAKGIGRIAVPYSGSAQGNVGIAVRPEKIRLERSQPGADRVCLRGRVTELAYYGDESNVFLENDTGVTINVNVPNEARTHELDLRHRRRALDVLEPGRYAGADGVESRPSQPRRPAAGRSRSRRCGSR